MRELTESPSSGLTYWRYISQIIIIVVVVVIIVIIIIIIIIIVIICSWLTTASFSETGLVPADGAKALERHQRKGVQKGLSNSC